MAERAPPEPDAGRRPGEPAGTGKSDELARRVFSAVILAAIALAALWVGGWAFALFLIALAATGLWEWTGICRAAEPAWPRIGLIAALVCALALAHLGYLVWAFGLLAGAAGLALAVACVLPAYGWAALGILYVAIPTLALIIFRHAEAPGITIIVLVALVVWATDIAAYFGGRSIGGPKLWPRISPKKTWSGAISGLSGAIIVALAFSAIAIKGNLFVAFIAAILLSLAAQAGDLAESAFKRHFGVKDSGMIIPGHGGVLDRMDGLYVALALAWLLAGMNVAPFSMVYSQGLS